MKSLRLVSWLAIRRLRVSPGLLLASSLGVLLAVTMVAATVIHSSTIAQAGLSYALGRTISQDALNFHILVPERPLGEADYTRLNTSVSGSIASHLGWLQESGHRVGRSPVFSSTPGPEGSGQTLVGADGYVYFQEGFQEHARLVDGRWPQDTAREDAEGTLHVEAVVGLDIASRGLRLGTGSKAFLAPLGPGANDRIVVEVVGVAAPADPEAPYWFGDLSRFRVETDGVSVFVPFYVSEQVFFEGAGRRYPMLLASYSWYVALDLASLRPESVPRIERAREALESEINRAFPRSLALSALGGVIEDYKRDLAFARVPLFLFATLVAGVVLYYLVLVVHFLSQSRASEIGLLRGRGASRLQIGVLLGLAEGMLVALPGAVGGPLLGWTIARMLPAGDPGLVTVSVPLTATPFIVGAAGALVTAVLFLAFNSWTSGQKIISLLWERGQTAGGEGRLRYAIDLMVLSAVGLVWWQIRGRGGFLAEELLGEGLEIDLSLLLGPVLALVAAGIILVRLLPIILRLLGAALSMLHWPWLGHALTRLARNSLSWSALAVLLAVATALAIFGATLNTSLGDSRASQARYAVGGDVVVADWKSLGLPLSPEEQREMLTAPPGVEEVTPVLRGSMALGGRSGSVDVSLVAVDPDAAQQATWFREDFADTSLDELFRPLRGPARPQEGVALPAEATAVGVWVNLQEGIPFHNLWAALRDSKGLTDNVQLGELHASGWAYLEGPVPEKAHLTPPYSLHTIFISGPQFSSNAYSTGRMALDDVTVRVGEELRVVESFDDELGAWRPMPHLDDVPDVVSLTPDAAHSGNLGAQFTWERSIGGELRGIFAAPGPLPLPAVGSSAFTPGQVLVGQVAGGSVPVVVRSTFQHFPTLYPGDGPFLIVNEDHLREYRRSLPQGAPLEAEEFWLALGAGADRAGTVAALEEITGGLARVRDQEEEARLARGNPLSGAGLGGVAWLALGTLSGVALLGLLLYAGLAARRSRMEMGLLWALGLSRRQVGVVLALEELLLAVVGLAVGAALGTALGGWSLQYLDVTSGGQTLTPPIDVIVDRGVATLAYLGVAAAAVLATLLALHLFRRTHIHEALRAEE